MMRPPMMRRTALIFLVLSPAAPAAAETIRVPSVRRTIQEGIDAARDGDVVLLGPGTYRGPGNRDLDLNGKAITVRGEEGAAATVIDCEGAGRGFDFQSGEGPAATVAGLTILNGRVADTGGAIRCTAGSSPTLADCVLSGGSAFSGGALYCRAASPVLTDCVLSGNKASLGGALSCLEGAAPRLERSTLRQNKAIDGGAVYAERSSPSLRDCEVLGNSATAGGAGFFFTSLPTVDGCTVMGNAATGNGGGFCFLLGSPGSVTNTRILGNSAGVGGALTCERREDTPSIINCTLYGNRASSYGGGINCHNDASPFVLNCILWGNSPESVCGDAYSCLADEDPFFLRPGAFDLDRFAPAVVGGEEIPMPDFVVQAGDYRVRSGSPAVDTGSPDRAPAVDIAGLPRPCGQGVDIGAHESCGDPVPGSFRRGDGDGNGRLDLNDAVLTLGYLFLGDPAPGCLKAADGDDSGRLDIGDPVQLLGHLFLGGAAPAPPRDACGLDPNPDLLSCEVHPACF